MARIMQARAQAGGINKQGQKRRGANECASRGAQARVRSGLARTQAWARAGARAEARSNVGREYSARGTARQKL
eukprot:6200655-Pleurochrysis_carterae.AAC.1